MKHLIWMIVIAMTKTVRRLRSQSNSLQDIEEENSFFKEQLNQSLIDYEHMKAEYERKLHEKDELIRSLRDDNPLVLAQSRVKTDIYSRL